MTNMIGIRVVITGASEGIGAELARQLGRHGCRLVLAARRKEMLDRVCEDVKAVGGEAYGVVVDVTLRNEVFRLADESRRFLGGIDIWVNNAGGGILHSVLEATEEDMLWQYRLNCLSSLWAYQAVIPEWIKLGNGHMLDINSVGGKGGFAYAGGYVAAKAAMSNLGDTLRQELVGAGVHHTTVYPGPTISKFSEARPDRTGGIMESEGRRLRQLRTWLARKVLHVQPTAHVARCIIRAMQKPVPCVYPHRWAALAALIASLAPSFVLRTIERSKRGDD